MSIHVDTDSLNTLKDELFNTLNADRMTAAIIVTAPYTISDEYAIESSVLRAKKCQLIFNEITMTGDTLIFCLFANTIQSHSSMTVYRMFPIKIIHI